jgi:hypothetical protein
MLFRHYTPSKYSIATPQMQDIWIRIFFCANRDLAANLQSPNLGVLK